MPVENSLKSNVDLRKLAPQWAIGYPIIAECFNRRGYSCVVTNGNERTAEQLAKTPTTKHPEGGALDFRTRHVPIIDKLPLIAAIRNCLGPQWDVVFENEGTDQEHCHIEFDPKAPATVEV